MNQTDLRISFKMDTGEDATWAKNHFGKDVWGTDPLRGWPRTIYGEWLEEKIGKFKYLRDRYYKVTGNMPTSSYFGDHFREKEVLNGDYIEWLETFYLKLILRNNDSI